jgi:S1-C subfamily serine protease
MDKKERAEAFDETATEESDENLEGKDYFIEEPDDLEGEIPRRRWPARVLAVIILLSMIGLTIPNLSQFFAERPQFLDENQALLEDEIVLDASPAVVSVKAYLNEGTSQGTVRGGTGFNVSSSGLIVTNSHVIEGADRISIQFPNGARYDSIGYEMYTDVDLAVIEIKGVELPYLTMDQSEPGKEGDEVTIIGNPLGYKKIAQRGIIGQSYQTKGVAVPVFDVGISLNMGNSGSPVINDQGKVIGVVFAVTDIEETTGLAIPIQALPQQRELN